MVPNASQLQIIIENKVNEVCEEIFDQTSISSDDTGGKDEEKKEGNIFMRALAVIPQVFTPILPVLTACRMLRALLAIITAFELAPTDSSTYTLIHMVSDVVFYFLPIFVVASASKVFKTNLYLSIGVVVMLLHPTFSRFVAAGESITLFGLPVALVNYASSL